jgi:glycosyltransferase 2 family protein
MALDTERAVSRRKKAFFLLKLTISIILMAYIIGKIDIANLSKKLTRIDPIPLMIAFLIGHADRALMAYKWRLLIHAAGHNITYKNALINTYMGNFAGQFLPAGVGGDVVRVFLLRKIGMPTIKVTASIGVERVFGLFALVTTAFMALILGRAIDTPVPSQLEIVVAGFFFVVSTLTILSFTDLSDRLADLLFRGREHRLIVKVRELIDCYLRYGERKSVLVKFYFLSIFEVTLVVSIYSLVSRAIFIDISLLELLVGVPVILMVQRIPISIQGIGVQEGLLVYYFLLLGKSLESALVLSIMLRLISILVISPGGLLYLGMDREIKSET